MAVGVVVMSSVLSMSIWLCSKTSDYVERRSHHRSSGKTRVDLFCQHGRLNKSERGRRRAWERRTTRRLGRCLLLSLYSKRGCNPKRGEETFQNISRVLDNFFVELLPC